MQHLGNHNLIIFRSDLLESQEPSIEDPNIIISPPPCIADEVDKRAGHPKNMMSRTESYLQTGREKCTECTPSPLFPIVVHRYCIMERDYIAVLSPSIERTAGLGAVSAELLMEVTDFVSKITRDKPFLSQKFPVIARLGPKTSPAITRFCPTISSGSPSCPKNHQQSPVLPENS